MPTIRRFRCWSRARDAQRPDVCGRMCVMNGQPNTQQHRLCGLRTLRTARANIRCSIWQSSRARCKRMRTLASNRLYDSGDVKEAACWAHVRRKFFDIEQAHVSPLAGEALKRIAELYAVENEIRGRPPDERKEIRQA